MEENGTMTVKELAKLLKISNIKAYQLAKNELETIRIGRAIRIPVQEYMKFIQG